MGDLPTAKQTGAMLALLALKKEMKGESPSSATIAERLGVTRQYVDIMFKSLEQKGFTAQNGEGWHARWTLTDSGSAWVKMTRKLVTPDPPKKR
jgi:Mn-dependent DtxR family transcriptional regulator